MTTDTRRNGIHHLCIIFLFWRGNLSVEKIRGRKENSPDRQNNNLFIKYLTSRYCSKHQSWWVYEYSVVKISNEEDEARFTSNFGDNLVMILASLHANCNQKQPIPFGCWRSNKQFTFHISEIDNLVHLISTKLHAERIISPTIPSVSVDYDFDSGNGAPDAWICASLFPQRTDSWEITLKGGSSGFYGRPFTLSLVLPL